MIIKFKGEATFAVGGLGVGEGELALRLKSVGSKLYVELETCYNSSMKDLYS